MSATDGPEIEQKVTDLDATSETANVSPKSPRPSLKEDPSQGRPTPKSSRVTWPEEEPPTTKSLPVDDAPRNSDSPGLYSALERIYNNPYRWETVTGTIMFLLALEVTRELWGIAVPLRVYQPFWWIIETYKCVIKTWNK